MNVGEPVTTNCPFCGGEVRAAARVCKHCKRSLEAPAAGAAPEQSSFNPALILAPAAIMRELRLFVVRRSLLKADQFDLVLKSQPTPDAAVLLGHIAAAGFITPLQVESIREAFRQDRGANATTVLNTAVARGFLTPAHAQMALTGYEPVVFQQTIGEYLVGAQLLTRPQADELTGASSAGSFADRAKARWASLSPSARKVIGGVAGVVVLGLIVSAAVGSADIREDATMNGNGFGEATFTNRGRRAGSLCGHIGVTCRLGYRTSATFCSGTVEPNETKQVPFVVANMSSARDFRVTDWRHDCSFDFYREPSGN